MARGIFQQPRFVLACFSLLVSSFGCVQARTETEKTEPAKLIVARGMNQVTLQWMAEADTYYSLYYFDPDHVDPETGARKPSWKIVPGYQNVKGEGKIIEVVDKNPRASGRRYRVHTVMPYELRSPSVNTR